MNVLVIIYIAYLIVCGIVQMCIFYSNKLTTYDKLFCILFSFAFGWLMCPIMLVDYLTTKFWYNW